MQIKKSLYIFTFTILSFSFSKHIFSQEVPKPVLDEINQISTIMMNAALEGNNADIIDHYAEDIIIMPDFQPAIRGKESLLSAYKEEKRKGLKYHSFNGTPEKRWMVNNDVFERGTFGMSVSTKDDPKPKAYYGSYFQIWKKQPDGKYKISYNIWNLDFNPF